MVKVTERDRDLAVKMWTGIKAMLESGTLNSEREIKSHVVLYKMKFCEEAGVHWMLDSPLCDKYWRGYGLTCVDWNYADWNLFNDRHRLCPLFRRYGKLYKTGCNDHDSWFSKAMRGDVKSVDKIIKVLKKLKVEDSDPEKIIQ